VSKKLTLLILRIPYVYEIVRLLVDGTNVAGPSPSTTNKKEGQTP
jgi:hypothetical protein